MAINGLIAKTIFDKIPTTNSSSKKACPGMDVSPPHTPRCHHESGPPASPPSPTISSSATTNSGNNTPAGSPATLLTTIHPSTNRPLDREPTSVTTSTLHRRPQIRPHRRPEILLQTAQPLPAYLWRFKPQCPPEYRPDQRRIPALPKKQLGLLKSFAFSPWNPEAVFHLANLLIQTNRPTTPHRHRDLPQTRSLQRTSPRPGQQSWRRQEALRLWTRRSCSILRP